MKVQPVAMRAEVKINNAWVLIDEHLPFAEHERNAQTAGATEVRTLDGAIHCFINRQARHRRTER